MVRLGLDALCLESKPVLIGTDVDSLSPEAIFFSPQDNDSPGAQLYLYRLLLLLASRESPGGNNPVLLSYPGAKKLASRLGLDSPERLITLFRDLGLGSLNIDAGQNYLRVTLKPLSPPDFLDESVISPGGGCELERGLIDGAMELITGVPVTTMETQCWSRGDSQCVFEGMRNDLTGASRFVPGSAAAPAAGFHGMEPLQSLAMRTGGAGSATSGFPPLRTWFLDIAVRELARARRHERPLSVMYVDLDDLGEINMAHGRPAGDQVISAVAAALSKSCRSEDYMWHHGEDEFAIVMAETDSGDAEIVARRLTTEILSAAEYVDVAATVSASIGFSTFPTHADSVPSLLSKARTALYVAKSLGKGRYQAAQAGPPESAGRRSGLYARETGGAGTPAPHARETGGAGTPAPSDEHTMAPAGDQDGREARSKGYGGASEGHLAQERGGSEAASASVTVVKSAAAGTSAVESQPQDEGSIEVMVASVGSLLLAGMKKVLSSEPGIRVVGEVTDPARIQTVIKDERPDLIFIDLQMATEGEFGLARMLDEENLPCKLAVFAMEVDQDVLKLAADYSVDGVILQHLPAHDVISALKAIYRGKTVLPEEVRVAISELEDNRRLLKDLSEREIEVLRLVAEGKSNSQISAELFITVNTVRFHLANVYQKLGVSNRTEAANHYLRQDLTPNGQTKLL